MVLKKLLMLSSAVPGILSGGGSTVTPVVLYQSFGLTLSLSYHPSPLS